MLKNKILAAAFGVVSVTQVQAALSAYDKVSGEPSLSVVSTNSLQSANTELASTVSDLEVSYNELSTSIEELEETYSSSSASDDDEDYAEKGTWSYLFGVSSSRNSAFYVDIYNSSTIYHGSSDGSTTYTNLMYPEIEDFICVVGTRGWIKGARSTSYTFKYYHVICK